MPSTPSVMTNLRGSSGLSITTKLHRAPPPAGEKRLAFHPFIVVQAPPVSTATHTILSCPDITETGSREVLLHTIVLDSAKY